jgi:hypothetical protein
MTSSLSMNDILQNMKRVKDEREEQERLKRGPPPYVPPGGWKQDPTIRMTLGSSRPVFIPSHEDHSIARFHLPPPRWDLPCSIDPLLRKALSRVPCRDPSGRVIFDLTRDARGGEIAGRWKPNGRALSALPPASSAMCSLHFRDHLVGHAAQTVDKVEALYNSLPATTERLRNIKAHVGADLDNLQRTRSKILTALEADDLERERTGRSRSRSPSPLPSPLPSPTKSPSPSPTSSKGKSKSRH